MNIDTSKSWFWILLDALIVVAIINVLFFVMPAISSLGRSFAPTHVITVSAEGKTTATPDLAELSFSVVSQGSDPKQLSVSSNPKMVSVMAFLTKEGIADKDITTTGYDLQPNYSYDQKTGKSSIFSYTLTESVTIKVRDLNKVGEVLGGLAPLGVNQIGGVNFTFDNPDTFLAAARTDAFNKAKAKAMQLASASGASLGAVVTASENGAPPTPIFYRTNGVAESAGAPTAAPAPPIQPGSQDVTDSVTVTYELR